MKTRVMFCLFDPKGDSVMSSIQWYRKDVIKEFCPSKQMWKEAIKSGWKVKRVRVTIEII